ncbi:MAG TPA: DUF6125 family protein [bacterium]
MTPESVRKYLLRSYMAVDGLWFMKVEKRFGFDAALDLDAGVWEVMAKIQARELKAALGESSGISALRSCFEQKCSIEGFVCVFQEGRNGFDVRIEGCHWYDKMIKAGREHLAATIGNRICATEYAVWASEFGCSFGFGGEKKICEGGVECLLRFEEIQNRPPMI